MKIPRWSNGHHLITLCILILLSFCHLPLVSRAANDDQSDKISVSWKDQLLSIVVEGSRFDRVLQEIERNTGVEILCLGECGQLISAKFENLPFEEAVKEVLPLKNYMVIIESNSEGPVKVTIHASSVSRQSQVSPKKDDSSPMPQKPEQGTIATGPLPDEIEDEAKPETISGVPLPDEVKREGADQSGEPLPDEIARRTESEAGSRKPLPDEIKRESAVPSNGLRPDEMKHRVETDGTAW